MSSNNNNNNNSDDEMEIDANSSLIKTSKSKFIPIKDRQTSRFLTKFERARVVGERAIEISNGSEIKVEIDEGVWDPLKIAEKELKQRKIDYVIRRYLPDNSYEDWRVNELIYD